VIPQGYPLTAARYEVADQVDGNPIYRASGRSYAVVGWIQMAGSLSHDALARFAPVLVDLSDLTDLAFIPGPDDQFEFVRGGD